VCIYTTKTTLLLVSMDQSFHLPALLLELISKLSILSVKLHEIDLRIENISRSVSECKNSVSQLEASILVLHNSVREIHSKIEGNWVNLGDIAVAGNNGPTDTKSE